MKWPGDTDDVVTVRYDGPCVIPLQYVYSNSVNILRKIDHTWMTGYSYYMLMWLNQVSVPAPQD
jgi:hypothetical protein